VLDIGTPKDKPLLWLAPPRVEYADAIYHLTSQGYARRPIVRDMADWDKWMELLQRSVEQHGRRVFAFALMTNHYGRSEQGDNS